jgi:uncharacterized protein (TIGR02300 family)
LAFDSAAAAWQGSRRSTISLHEDRHLAIPELGAKQLCPACGAKFYDLGRRPAVCPKCGDSFDPEEALRTRRVRARAGAAPDYEDDEVAKPKEAEVEGFEDEADETPEIDADAVLEPVEADDDAVEDPGAPIAPTGDLGVDFAEEDEELVEEEADDLPFIDDDEDDDFEGDIEGLPGEGKED